MNAIEALYYGELIPQDKEFRFTRQTAKLLKLLTRNEDALLETMTDRQKELFEKYKDAQNELDQISDLDSFTTGFKLGIRLIMAAGSDEEANDA